MSLYRQYQLVIPQSYALSLAEKAGMAPKRLLSILLTKVVLWWAEELSWAAAGNPTISRGYVEERNYGGATLPEAQPPS